MSSNTNSSSREESNENDVIRTTLKTIGVEECDPAVFVALAEYSKRYAAELLCDAKDYSKHANKNELDDSDVHLAVQLSDVKTTGLSNSVLTTLDVFMDVNLKPLPLISTNNIFHRVPGVHRRRPTNPDPQNQKPSANTNTTATPGHNISNPPSGDNTNQNPSQLPITSIPVDLLNRNFSFVPGVEAYPPPPKVNPNPASNLQRYNPSSAKKQRTGGINRSSSSTSQNPSSGSSTPQYTVQYLSEEERQLNRKQQQMEYAKL